jgi:hypothetical protein
MNQDTRLAWWLKYQDPRIKKVRFLEQFDCDSITIEVQDDRLGDESLIVQQAVNQTISGDEANWPVILFAFWKAIDRAIEQKLA